MLIKINIRSLIILIGIILIPLSIFMPWYTAKVYGSETIRTYYINPLFFSTDVEDTTNSSFERITVGFYGVDTSFVGILGVLGNLFSIIGGLIRRWKISLSGGLLTLLSTFAFAACLPGYIPHLTISLTHIILLIGPLFILLLASLALLRR